MAPSFVSSVVSESEWDAIVSAFKAEWELYKTVGSQWNEDYHVDNMREELQSIADNQYGGSHRFFNFGRLLYCLENDDDYKFFKVQKTDTGYEFEFQSMDLVKHEEDIAWTDICRKRSAPTWVCHTDGLYIITNADCEYWGIPTEKHHNY